MLHKILKDHLESTTGCIRNEHLESIITNVAEKLKAKDFSKNAKDSADLYSYDSEFANGYESGFNAGLDFLIDLLIA